MIEAEPFVRRAPEIAEEILAKTASLPKDLRAFTKALFEKTASVKEEKLQLPQRLTLDDLRKIASTKQVDLPDVGNTPVDSSSSVVGDLRKLAHRYEVEESNDALATAAAIFLEKSAAAARAAGGLKGWFKARFVSGSPERAKRLTAIKKEKGIKGETIGTKEYGVAEEAKAMQAAAAGTAKKQEMRGRAWEKTLGAAPYVAGAIGIPAAAVALRKPQPRRQTYQKVF